MSAPRGVKWTCRARAEVRCNGSRGVLHAKARLKHDTWTFQTSVARWGRQARVDAGEIAGAERDVGWAHAAPAGQFEEAATWARPPRLRSDLLFSGFAGVSLGAGRTHRARGSRRTWRSGKAAFFYHYLSPVFA